MNYYKKLKNFTLQQKEKGNFQKFGKFLLSGGLAFLLDLIILNLVSHIFFEGRNYIILFNLSVPKLVSASIALIFSFYLQREWVFKAAEDEVKTQVGRFIISSIINIILVSIFFTIFHYSLNQVFQPGESFKTTINSISNLLSEIVKMFVSFFLYKNFVFKKAN
jgi:putative flippase GtrA